MVRMYYVAAIQKTPDKNVVLSDASDLADFSFFRRGGVREFMRFSCCVLAARLEAGSKVSVREQVYVCHVTVGERGNFAVAAVTDDEYPLIAVHKCLQDLLLDFVSRCDPHDATKNSVQHPDLKMFLEDHKVPRNMDKLTMIRNEIDETKIVLHQTMHALLNREENLDDLVNKTEELSTQAKAFYKTAKRTNACCNAL